MSLSYKIGLLPLYDYFFLSGRRELHQHELLFFFFSSLASRISVPPCIRIEAAKVLYLHWLGQSLVYTVTSGLFPWFNLGLPVVSRLVRETGVGTPRVPN
jgi:hypothetical protein